MCTVSWFRQPDGYTLFFNRDESRSRQPGIPPAIETIQDTKVIFPRDPEGNGTWLLVNEHGLSLGLLNFYDAQVNYQPTESQSRGQLPLIHAACKNLEEAESKFQTLELSPYPPFHFLVVEPSGRAILITWDGGQTKATHPECKDLPVTTSSFKTDTVVAARRSLFSEQVLTAENPLSAMESYHKTTGQLPDTHAVLMTRENAKTVSVSRIDISGVSVQMTYQARAGVSRELDSPQSMKIPRKSQEL